MELAVEAGVGERAVQRVDAVGDEQRGPFVPLGQEVAHRPIHRARQPHGDAVQRDDREGSVERAHPCGVAAQDAASRLIGVGVVEAGQARIEQIDDAIDGAPHAAILMPHAGASCPS